MYARGVNRLISRPLSFVFPSMENIFVLEVNCMIVDKRFQYLLIVLIFGIFSPPEGGGCN